MVWLARRGHPVVASEISPIAIEEFFSEQGLEPSVTRKGPHTKYVAGPYEIFAGDALELTGKDLGPVDAAYDRAALIALPPDMRRRYAARMTELLPAAAPLLLLALEYPQEMKGGPPFSVDRAEVDQLYAANFSIRELARIDLIAESPKFAEVGIAALDEVAYALTRTRG
jgi:thiopurine S-methyltransferase